MDKYELFLKYSYPEARDMGLHFITVVTAVLIFSLNFAEKVFNFKNASGTKRLVVILGWCLFLISIILCGIGLTFNAVAGGGAVYRKDYYSHYAQLAYGFIIAAGLFFIAGLVFLIISAALSHSANKSNHST